MLDLIWILKNESRHDSPVCWWIIRPICCANIYEKWRQMMQRERKRSFFKPWWKNGVILFFGAKTRTPISWFKQINASSKCCFAKSLRHPDETVTCEAGEVRSLTSYKVPNDNVFEGFPAVTNRLLTCDSATWHIFMKLYCILLLFLVMLILVCYVICLRNASLLSRSHLLIYLTAVFVFIAGTGWVSLLDKATRVWDRGVSALWSQARHSF